MQICTAVGTAGLAGHGGRHGGARRACGGLAGLQAWRAAGDRQLLFLPLSGRQRGSRPRPALHAQLAQPAQRSQLALLAGHCVLGVAVQRLLQRQGGLAETSVMVENV